MTHIFKYSEKISGPISAISGPTNEFNSCNFIYKKKIIY